MEEEKSIEWKKANGPIKHMVIVYVPQEGVEFLKKMKGFLISEYYPKPGTAFKDEIGSFLNFRFILREGLSPES